MRETGGDRRMAEEEREEGREGDSCSVSNLSSACVLLGFLVKLLFVFL